EIRELDRKMDLANRDTAEREANAVRLGELVREAEALKARLAFDLQEVEKTILTMDHRVRTLTADHTHAEQRRNVAQAEIERFLEERRELDRALQHAETQLDEIGAAKKSIEDEIAQHASRQEALRIEIEVTRRDWSEIQSKLAVLEERRLTAGRELKSLEEQAANLEERSARASQMIRPATEQQDQTRTMIADLIEAREVLVSDRDRLDQTIRDGANTLDELRRALREAETRWDEIRGLLDSWKDRNNALEIEKTQVESALKYLAASCW